MESTCSPNLDHRVGTKNVPTETTDDQTQRAISRDYASHPDRDCARAGAIGCGPALTELVNNVREHAEKLWAGAIEPHQLAFRGRERVASEENLARDDTDLRPDGAVPGNDGPRQSVVVTTTTHRDLRR